MPNLLRREPGTHRPRETNREKPNLSAFDPDARENGTISYYIQSGNGAKLFNLDPTSGALTVARSLSSSGMGKHLLDLRALDGGEEQRYENAQLMIIVDDSEPKAPPEIQTNMENRRINLFIIIAIVVASFVISTILLTSICLVMRKARHDNSRNGRFRFANGAPARNLVDGRGNPLMEVNVGSIYAKAPTYSTLGLLHESPQQNGIYQTGNQDTYAVHNGVSRYVGYLATPDEVAYSTELGYYGTQPGPATSLLPVPGAYAMDDNSGPKRNSLANSSSNDRDSGNGDSVDAANGHANSANPNQKYIFSTAGSSDHRNVQAHYMVLGTNSPVDHVGPTRHVCPTYATINKSNSASNNTNNNSSNLTSFV
ncbi:bahd acyltransferase [Cichlidogyrus casuarinus]|uniref:Bahd acyltransferase n=1 Tax=Cichlidogyrus casuarinus TaxID=1844966 RepID=A0ABD2PZ17_9PLAT